MTPKLSIITINFNNIKGLRRTLDSVFRQSYFDLEYIVIDGGSTDGSLSVIREFQVLHSNPKSARNFNFQWLSEPDSGIYNAMNKGIIRANGEYCFFLNSGDFFVSQSVLFNVMQVQATEDILFGNLLVCLDNKVTEKCFGKAKLSFMDIYLSLLKHQASFIRRSLFNKFGLYNESLEIVADWEFFLKTVGLQNVSYRYINEDIAYFDNDGVSNNSHLLTMCERNRVLETYVPSMILADYRRFEKYEFLNPAFSYKLTTLALRVIAKSAKMCERIGKKR